MNGIYAAVVSTVVGVGLTGLMFVIGFLLKRLIYQLDRVTDRLEQVHSKLQTLDIRVAYVENKIKPDAKEKDGNRHQSSDT